MTRLVVIDGKSVLYRGYYAMGNLSMSDGTPTGGVYGFAAISLEVIKKLKPDYVAVAWDKSKTNIGKRREIYAEYKANRHKAPDDFYAQIPLVYELLDALGWKLFECDGYEADDIIGALAQQADERKGWETIMISSDLDMLQIVDHNTRLYRLKTGFSDVEELDIAALEKKYGIKKAQFLDLKALKGDSSDNIPGVPGVGEKGAVKLLNEYGTLDGIYEYIDEISGALGEKLRKGKESAYMSKKLSEIMFDAPVELDDVPRLKMNRERVLAELEKLEFKSLIRKFSQQLFAESPSPSGMSYTGTPTEPQQAANLSGTSGIYVAAEEGKNDSEKSVGENLPNDFFVSWDVKAAMHNDDKVADKVLRGERFWDLGQGAFLLNPLNRINDQVDLTAGDVLAREYQKQMGEFEELPKLRWVADNLDMPLIPILYKMEKKGVKIDVVKFTTLKEEFVAEAKEIEQKIYSMSGHPFNVNSPLQLSEVLYGELGLPTKGVKKKQRFYSTGQKELDKLRGLHPIIELIERMREVTKLLSTYIEPLPNLADGEGRIHTTYTQNVTATGRLSSVGPNLQNIPVRTDEGKKIREGFVADAGKVFVSADYAQFELRLAAALAGDKKLTEDFNSGADIHTKTASDTFKVPMDEVTKEQRRVAKVINFGVLYGMSAKGLSDAAGMTVGGAKEFIDKYFALRKPIREYLDQALAQARELGYVETVFGRRRPTPDVKAPNYVVRAAAERAAMNMPIQGTEADLMKLAMLKLDKELPEGADLILQVHDSLVVECEEKLAEGVAGILKRVMEGVAPELPVKLLVEVAMGKNWGEL
ncbi:DNA polymerase [Candidatus Saccharibacteria bacterium]|nr:DNA polymerase [Candidatus Saccharibacteria bacterium]